MKLSKRDKNRLIGLGMTPDELTRVQAVASYAKVSLPRMENAPISHNTFIRLAGRDKWLSSILYASRNQMTPTSVIEWGDAKTTKVEIRFTPTMVPRWYWEKYALT